MNCQRLKPDGPCKNPAQQAWCPECLADYKRNHLPKVLARARSYGRNKYANWLEAKYQSI